MMEFDIEPSAGASGIYYEELNKSDIIKIRIMRQIFCNDWIVVHLK